MLRILLICTGNTCRSPMAEALLNNRIRLSGLENEVRVLSAGLAAAGGSPASGGALAVMGRRGLELAGHRARPVLAEYLQAADIVLTMTRSHKRQLLNMHREAAGKVQTLAEFAGEEAEVADPYGGGTDVYEACAAQLERLVDKAWEKIAAMAGKSPPTVE